MIRPVSLADNRQRDCPNPEAAHETDNGLNAENASGRGWLSESGEPDHLPAPVEM